MRIVRWVPFTIVERLKVLAMLSVCRASMGRVSIEQRTAVKRGEQPLVRIDNVAVCTLNAIEERSHRRRGKTRCSVGAIHMHPPTLSLTGIGDGREVVNHAQIRRATCSHDSKNSLTVLGREGVDKCIQGCPGERWPVRNRKHVNIHYVTRLSNGGVGATRR